MLCFHLTREEENKIEKSFVLLEDKKPHLLKGQLILDTNLTKGRSEEEVILHADTHLYIIKKKNNMIICGMLDVTDTLQEG